MSVDNRMRAFVAVLVAFGGVAALNACDDTKPTRGALAIEQAGNLVRFMDM